MSSTAQLPAAGALTGAERLPLSRLSSTDVYTATTISAQASDNSINSSAAALPAWMTAGRRFKIAGFTGAPGNNADVVQISASPAPTASKVVITGVTLVDDAAGESVTVTAWESKSTTAAALRGNTVTALTISAGVVNIDCALGDYFTLALTADVTGMTFSNLPGAGFGASKMVLITQDATARTVAWPASFRWEGAAPSVSTASGAVDVLAITTFDNGTKWDATLSKGRV